MPARKSAPARDKGNAWPIVAVATAATLALAFLFVRQSTTPPQTAERAMAPTIASDLTTPPAPSSDAGIDRNLAARTQPVSDLPPLPLAAYPAERPRQVIAAVYEFAARHPEVLEYVPCFCGCETSGHRANDDCFVASRDAGGRVVSWDAHGIT